MLVTLRNQSVIFNRYQNRKGLPLQRLLKIPQFPFLLINGRRTGFLTRMKLVQFLLIVLELRLLKITEKIFFCFKRTFETR